MKKALVFGASGYVGRFVLDMLLKSSAYDKVTVVVRRDLGINHPKLTTLIGGYDTLDSLTDQIAVDDVFITLGTTKKKTPDVKEYYKVDHDYPVMAARFAKERGASTVLLLTAVGSDENSGFFYTRTKGEAERDVIAVGLAQTHIFQPSMILGQRAEFRLAEVVAKGLWPLIDVFLRLVGPSKFRGISGENIAKAMVTAAGRGVGKVQKYEWKEMMGLVAEYNEKG